MTNIGSDQIKIRHIRSGDQQTPGHALSGHLLILTFLIDQNLGMHREIDSGWPQKCFILKPNKGDKGVSLIVCILLVS